jgi:hypothetical protein
MTDSFNSDRFWGALKRHLQDVRKGMLRNFLIMLCYLLVLQLFFIFYLASHNQYTYILEVTVTYSAATFIFVIVYGATYIMGPRKPERRSAFVELQATALEKYIIRYVYVTVILALGFILAYICADALRMLFTGLVDGDYVCGLPVLMNEMSHANTQPFDWMLLIFELGAFFFGHSIFVLGGTLFPRYQFLLTSVCFCAFIALLTVLPINSFIDQVDKTGTVTGYVALVVFYLLAAFNYWYAYIRFRRQFRA